jgi:hypothetical protein
MGFEVFPLIPKTKIPYKGSHGMNDGTTDEAQIDHWWNFAPDSNIGIHVPLDVIVIDIDPRNGGSKEWTETILRGLPTDTYTVTSGRGDGGEHLYFRLPKDCPELRKELKILEGVDFKAQRKGFVLGWGSIHGVTEKPYVWNMKPMSVLPVAIVTQISKRADSPYSPGERKGTQPVRKYHVLEVDDIIHTFRRKAGEGRNTALWYAALRVGLLTDVPQDVNLKERLVEEGTSAGLSRSEVVKTINSGFKAALESAGTNERAYPLTVS